MASTYTLISSQVLASTATSVTFSSIPATYTDLVLKISARDTATGVIYSSITATFDSTSSVYSRTDLIASGSTASSSRQSVAYFYVDYPGSNAGMTANTFGSAEVYIPNYAGSANKPFSVSSTVENNSATVNENYISAGYYRSGAIATITLTAAANYSIGSSFYLYGISNA